jgi:hypothetical protein
MKSPFNHLFGGLEHDFYFSHHIGNVIIPTAFPIFLRGVGKNHQPVTIQFPFFAPHLHPFLKPYVFRKPFVQHESVASPGADAYGGRSRGDPRAHLGHGDSASKTVMAFLGKSKIPWEKP